MTADVTTTLIQGVRVETHIERHRLRFLTSSCFVPFLIAGTHGRAFVTRLWRGTCARSLIPSIIEQGLQTVAKLIDAGSDARRACRGQPFRLMISPADSH